MYLERFKLDGRVAVVTGGAQAIGFACVEALAEAGAHVYIADRNPTAGKEAQAALDAKGVQVDFIEMDVTDPAAVNAAAAQVFNEKHRIDILVCNAGIARSETPAEGVVKVTGFTNALDDTPARKRRPTRQVRATPPMQSSVSACKPAG
jgi:NAD(P)-dependent dehydrogenase (short-subunit alcohol dehydrogenase family)